MDVLALLKFWRTAAGPDPPAAGDFVSSIDDDESFFDLVFTTSGDESRSSFSFSSPDSVFLNSKRRILPLDSRNTKTKTKTPQSPLRLLKLGFQNSQNNQKLKSENKTSSDEIEEVKIGALLKRDNSLRNRLRTEELLEGDQVSSKRFSKVVINKYLNRMKPNNLNVSKRCSEKSRLSDSSLTPSSSPAPSVFCSRKDERKSGSRTVFGGVRKHLGKNRSSSAIVQSPARKSDDSALEQQDGIQRAILHCKRSFNSPYQDSMLSRSGSAPSNNQARVSVEEQKRSSI